MKVTKNCKYCNKEFQTEQKEINRGNGKFCSLTCVRLYNKKEQEHNTTCSYCNKTFYRNKSKQTQSKSGLQFCSRKCKDHAQRIENNFYELWPKFYGTGLSNKAYRDKAFREYPHKCNICNYNSVIDVLEVHHIDGNRKNADIKNLEILCPTCHRVKHIEVR